MSESWRSWRLHFSSLNSGRFWKQQTDPIPSEIIVYSFTWKMTMESRWGVFYFIQRVDIFTHILTHPFWKTSTTGKFCPQIQSSYSSLLTIIINYDIELSLLLDSLKKEVNLSEYWYLSSKDLLLLQHICWDKEPSQAGEVRVWLLERMRRADKEGRFRQGENDP